MFAMSQFRNRISFNMQFSLTNEPPTPLTTKRPEVSPILAPPCKLQTAGCKSITQRFDQTPSSAQYSFWDAVRECTHTRARADSSLSYASTGIRCVRDCYAPFDDLEVSMVTVSIQTYQSQGPSFPEDEYARCSKFSTWEEVLDVTESDFDALRVKLGHRRRLPRKIAGLRGLSIDRPLTSSWSRRPTVDRPLWNQKAADRFNDKDEICASNEPNVSAGGIQNQMHVLRDDHHRLTLHIRTRVAKR